MGSPFRIRCRLQAVTGRREGRERSPGAGCFDRGWPRAGGPGRAGCPTPLSRGGNRRWVPPVPEADGPLSRSTMTRTRFVARRGHRRCAARSGHRNSGPSSSPPFRRPRGSRALAATSLGCEKGCVAWSWLCLLKELSGSTAAQRFGHAMSLPLRRLRTSLSGLGVKFRSRST